MDNISYTTEEYVIRNKFSHPEAMTDPKEIKQFYETFTAKFEGTAVEDQLELWNNYARWASGKYGDDSEILFDIISRITYKFRFENLLYNSTRLVNFFAKYSKKVNKPLDVYKFMEEYKIGNLYFFNVK